MTEQRRAPERTDRALADRPIEDHVTWFVRLTYFTGRTIMRCLTRVRIEGLEGGHLATDGPLIIASNHLSNADPIVIGSWLGPALGRRVHWLGKQEALEVPIIGWAMIQNGVFGIRRGAADVEAFRLAKRILDEGHVLVVFPEGTRSPTAGLQEAKDGLAVLALRTSAPILPIGMSGTERFWPRGRRMPRPGGRVTMHVGTPFRLDALRPGEDRRAVQHAATNQIMHRIAELLPSENRGVYADLVDPIGGGATGEPGTKKPAGP
jgi:1-acyl-sn-glycerol-3-phosphate acyltransferase